MQSHDGTNRQRMPPHLKTSYFAAPDHAQSRVPHGRSGARERHFGALGDSWCVIRLEGRDGPGKTYASEHEAGAADRVNGTQWILIGVGVLAATVGLLAFAGRGPQTRGLDGVGRIYRGTSGLLLSAYVFIAALNLDSEHEVWIWIGLVLLFTALGLMMAARQRVVPIPPDERA
jgi:hypothetical protein